MSLLDELARFGWLDAAALAVFLACWLGIGEVIEGRGTRHLPSVAVLMADYRRDWMHEFVTRQPRIFDASIIDSLRQGTAFFASACMIAIGGGLAIVGNPQRITGVAGDFSVTTAAAVIEVKVLLVVLMIAHAFLKFVWAHRLFGYCAILMAAVPNDPADALAYPRAAQAAEINITAARSFNRGLRSVYFALGALGWLAGPWGFLGATAVTVATLLRREFASESRRIMLDRRR